jgi:protein SCO1/2
MRRRPLLTLLALATALLAVLVLIVILGGSSHRTSPLAGASVSGPASPFDGAALPSSPPAPDFKLTDQTGGAVSLAGHRGRVTVLAFLYSSCGATCVLIAQQIRGALDDLTSPASVLIVSADPASDTPARVRRFLGQVSLSGRAQYLTGSLAQLRPVWRAYRVAPAADGRAAFERTANVLLIDRLGRKRVLFGLEQLTPESLAHDIARLDGEPGHP